MMEENAAFVRFIALEALSVRRKKPILSEQGIRLRTQTILGKFLLSICLSTRLFKNA